MIVRVQPSDYVVRMGWGGTVLSAGQGRSFWLWPWESYVRFPATLQWMLFSASQITRENQGIDVKGAFSWRVVDPIKAYQNLNFLKITTEEVRELLGARSCEPERTVARDHGPLMRTTLLIRQLAESVTRSAIANMTLEEALRDRRAIVENLTHQIDAIIAPWGAAITSIEIVDIYVSSREVFSNMQADYRERLRLTARSAHIAAEEEIAEKQLASTSRVRKIEHDGAVAGLALRSEIQQKELDVQEGLDRRKVEVESGVRMDGARAAADCDMTELNATLERRRLDHAFSIEQRRDEVEHLRMRNEVMGQVNEAYRAQQLIDTLPRIVEGMKPDKTTVFANSLPAASIEGLASSLLSIAELAGLKLGRNGS